MMEKTININISGTLFRIEDDAFTVLRDYLQEINNRFRSVKGGLETIEDIEQRVAEIFQSAKGTAGVISKENVDSMISIMGKPEDFEMNDYEQEQPVYTEQKKRMYRNPDDSIISGVCGGIGAYLDTDPVLFRILFVVFTAFYGAGFLIYIALWIALPPANNEARKREMYGNANYSSMLRSTLSKGDTVPGYRNYQSTSRIGNAINEVFRAIGRVFYIAMRIFLIIIGGIMVLTGFLLILCFVLIFIFKYPGVYSPESLNFNYFPDLLKYLVNPEVAPWIIILSFLALVLPCLAVIYWGIKMIFWLKVRDGIYNLAGLVLWILVLAALSIILFNEGISFVETAKTSSHQVISKSPGTLYLKSGKKVSDLSYDKELYLRDDGYNIFINDSKSELYIRPYLTFNKSDDSSFRIELRKRSSGKTTVEARKKTEELLYNYRINADTIFLDEYFTVPSGRKWSADNIGINIYVPEGTIIKTDKESENLFHSRYSDEDEYEDSDTDPDPDSGTVQRDRSWTLTDDGLIFNNEVPSGPEK